MRIEIRKLKNYAARERAEAVAENILVYAYILIWWFNNLGFENVGFEKEFF